MSTAFDFSVKIGEALVQAFEQSIAKGDLPVTSDAVDLVRMLRFVWTGPGSIEIRGPMVLLRIAEPVIKHHTPTAYHIAYHADPVVHATEVADSDESLERIGENCRELLR